MSEQRTTLRRSIRLPAIAYREPGSTWLVTVSTHDRTPWFSDPSLAGATLAMILDESPRRGLDLQLACLMPDHAHLLVTVTTGDLVAAVGAIKSISTRLFHGFGYSGPLWQGSFHDEGLRNERLIERAARYILDNPVEAGIVATWEDYDLIAGTWVGKT